MSIGLPHRDDRHDRQPGAQSSAQTGALGASPEKKKSRWNAGLRMARPGLEPGKPRLFQSLVGISLTAAQCLQLSGLSPAEPNQVDDRKLRSFLVDLGSGMRSGAQWSAAARASPRRAATRRGTRRGVRGGLRAGRLLGDARRDVRQTWAGSEIPISLHSRAASDSMPSEWERSCAPLSTPTGSRAT